MLESDLQDKCISHAKNMGVYTIRIQPDGFGLKGIPDLIMCIDGKFVGVELKVGNNTKSPAQRIQAKRIQKAGGLVYEVRTLNEFKKLIKENRE